MIIGASHSETGLCSFLGRSCRHIKPGNLDKWLVVYEGKNKPIANELINTLYNVCTPMVSHR